MVEPRMGITHRPLARQNPLPASRACRATASGRRFRAGSGNDRSNVMPCCPPGMSAAEFCRQQRWEVGDVLSTECLGAAVSRFEIKITAIGRKMILAVDSTDGEESE